MTSSLAYFLWQYVFIAAGARFPKPDFNFRIHDIDALNLDS